MNKENIFFLASPYIGDSVFLWDVANRLASVGKNIIFVTKLSKLFQNINETNNIAVFDIVSTEWKGFINNSLVISNHEAQKTEFGYIPEPLKEIPHESYKLLDLHAKQKLGRTVALESYTDLMWKKVAEECGIMISDNRTIEKKPFLFDKEMIENKFPWTVKPYVLIISGTTANSKKYSGWNTIADEIERIYKFKVIIADDPAEHISSDPRRYVFSLDEFPLLFKHLNCTMVLGGDTGMCHLAAWMQKHTAIINSVSDPSFWTNGSKYYHPIIGAKNLEHIKEMQKNDLRYDPPEIRGEGFVTTEGFGADLTKNEEILDVVNEVLENQTISS